MLDEESYKTPEMPSLSLNTLNSGGQARVSTSDQRGAGPASHNQIIPRPLQYSVEALLAKNDPRIGMNFFILPPIRPKLRILSLQDHAIKTY